MTRAAVMGRGGGARRPGPQSSVATGPELRAPTTPSRCSPLPTTCPEEGPPCSGRSTQRRGDPPGRRSSAPATTTRLYLRHDCDRLTRRVALDRGGERPVTTSVTCPFGRPRGPFSALDGDGYSAWDRDDNCEFTTASPIGRHARREPEKLGPLQSTPAPWRAVRDRARPVAWARARCCSCNGR